MKADLPGRISFAALFLLPASACMSKERVILEAIESARSEQALAWSLEAFQPRIGLCTSFAAEDLVPRTSY